MIEESRLSMARGLGKYTVSFYILILCNIVIFFNVSAMPNLLNQLIKEFSLDFASASRIIYYYMFAYGISALFVVFFHEILNRYKSLIISMHLIILLNCIIALVRNYQLILICRIWCGISGSIVAPTSLTIIKDLFHETKEEKIGYLFGANSVAGITGTLLSGYFSWRLLFLIPAIMGVIALFLLVALFPRQDLLRCDKRRKMGVKRLLGNYVTIFAQSNHINVFILIFINSFICTGFYSYFGYHLKTYYRLSLLDISYILPLSIIGSILMNFMIGKISRIFSSDRIIQGGFFLLAISLLLFKVSWTWIIVLIMLIFGIARAMIHSMAVSSWLDFPESIRSNASSFNSFIVFLGGSLGVRILPCFFRTAGFTFAAQSIALAIMAISLLSTLAVRLQALSK
ncbi:MAG: MFS transporter [bacterium]